MTHPIDPHAGRFDQRPELTRDIDRLLAVVAHPDDESFGLGALLDRFAACGIDVSVLCFTHGEASTLRGDVSELAEIRAAELRAAVAELGVEHVELLDYPDGGLDRYDLDELSARVSRAIDARRPTHLLVFDEGGVTGHADHDAATSAALRSAQRASLPVLAWVLPDAVATRLNEAHGTRFRGRSPQEIDARLSVSRIRQGKAIAAHRSQAEGNVVLQHRLRLLGDAEALRMLYRPAGQGAPG